MRSASWNTIFLLSISVAIATPMIALAALAMGPQ